MEPHLRTHEDYLIGIICALAIEKAAVVAMLDEIHPRLREANGDENEYTFGRIGFHNVVVACLPAGLMGNSPAAIVANNMQRSFPIRFGLMVGVGGGVWSKKNDIRLGDVVVSQPAGRHGGVVQWDFGRMGKDGKFHRNGSLDKPPLVLLHALQNLKEREITDGVSLEASISLMIRNKPRMGETYRYQGAENDQLFEATYDHEGDETCEACNTRLLVQRPARKGSTPKIHYGNIASGNEVMRHGTTRDKIAIEEGVICFEMEAAGLMDNFRCLVIRGICDYADSHKNKTWQPYAAATASAYAREILLSIPEKIAENSRLPIISRYQTARRGDPNQFFPETSDFINRRLANFFHQDGENRRDVLENLVQEATIRAEQVTEEFNLGREFMPGLIKLSFYDFFILCDDSESMQLGNRIQALQETVHHIAELAIKLAEPLGISIRFLNFDKDEDGNFDNLSDLDDIDRKVKMADYHGPCTRLGQELDLKVVQYIVTKAASNNLKKPVIVAVITDGEPTGEPQESLSETIWSCKRQPALLKMGEVSVVFLLCRVGDSPTAEGFLKSIEGNKKLKNMVYCSRERIDKRLPVFQKAKDDPEYFGWLIRLFLTALDSAFR